jgi:uncharacterized protein (TIGR02246 family)
MTPRTRDEAGVRAVEAAYDRAWAAGDIGALVDCFTSEAVVVNPRGDVARGVGQIREALAGFLGGPARGSVHVGRILRIEFVTEDVAVVDGEAAVRRHERERGFEVIDPRDACC